MAKKFEFDYIVIGSGPAGSTAALMAAKAGLKVALVEANKWGGSSLNFRDIPYRAALNFSHLYAKAIRGSRFGISSANLRYNYPTVQNWQDFVTKRAGRNSKKVFEDAGVTCIHATANFLSPYEISAGSRRLSAPKILIATGARPADSGITGLDSVEYYVPDTALNIPRPPRTLAIVGGGTTGCELAQHYATLGTKVIIFDLTNRLLPREDEEVGQVVSQYFEENLRIKVLTESRVVSIEPGRPSKKVVFLRDGQEKAIFADTVILATGTTPNFADLGLENAGVKFAKSGIKTLKTLQTSIKHIAAAGDVLDASATTERAAYEGALATSNLFNRSKELVNYNGFIRTTDIYPPIATVGITEDDCIKRDKKIKKVIVPLSSISASNTHDFRIGFIKLLADKQGKVLGATIMCPEAELVAEEIALSLRHKLSVTDLASTPHVATSWGELVRVAASKLSN